jgi:hypothetical protein
VESEALSFHVEALGFNARASVPIGISYLTLSFNAEASVPIGIFYLASRLEP